MLPRNPILLLQMFVWTHCINIYLQRFSIDFIIQALFKILYISYVFPKIVKYDICEKKINILRRQHFIRKLPFLVACIFPISGGLSSIRPFQSTTRNISFNISEICFYVILSNYNVKGVGTKSVSTLLFSQ